MRRQDSLSMLEERDIVDEEWIVVVNKNKYELNLKQAKILEEAITRNSRGIVMFKDFAISIPYIIEFYKNKTIYKESPQLPEPDDLPKTPEERERLRRKVDEIRRKLKEQLFK